MDSKLPPDIVSVPLSHCLHCGKPMNMLGTGDSRQEARPSPGDNAICMRCGAVMKLDENLRLRGMTEEEIYETLSDPETLDQLGRMVKALHFVRHLRN